MRQPSHAFTLVELLVVVAIIVALVAMLVPSLNKSVEVAHRAACGSGEHQMGVLLLSYAFDNKRALPPGNATVFNGGAWGIDSTWQVQSNNPLGLAFLFARKYIVDARMFYCPSWRHPLLQYGVVNSTTEPHAGFPAGSYGGFPAPPATGPTQSYGISYHYRSTFNPLARTAPTLGLPGNPAIAADHWTRREDLYGVAFGHGDGYNTLYLDGHAAWKAISVRQIELLQPVGTYTNDNWTLQEIIWQDWFDR